MRDIQLHLGTFTPSLVLHLASKIGALQRTGLEVKESAVSSSPGQFRSLEAGEFDLVMTSPDNVLAYRFLAKNPLGRNLSVEMIGAVDRGLGLSLCLAPSIAEVSDLKGETVGVDVPESGFAFVAYSLLDKAGLRPEDYSVKALGSTPRRASALIAGDCTATILNAGNELRARGAGCTVFSAVTDIGPYLGTVVAAMTTDDPAVNEARRRFVDALLETVEGILTGKLQSELIDAAMSLLGLSDAEAQAHYECVLNPATGLVSDGIVDLASISTLLELRRTYMPAAELATIASSLDTVVTGRAAS